MKPLGVLAILGSMMAVSPGCSSEYPTIHVGEVRGTVQYTGTALGRYENPVLVVGAFAYEPTFLDEIQAGGQPLPHAVFYEPNPEFGAKGIAYRLLGLTPFSRGYFVTAVILDMMNASAAPAATGLYPSLGLFLSKPEEGPVMVEAGQTLDDIDFAVLDVPQ